MDPELSLVEILSEKFPHLQVLDRTQTIEKFGKTTFSAPLQLSAAISVLSTNDICDLMALANSIGFHLYPVSSAQNWGYGSVSNLDTLKGKVILDLSQMRAITPTCKELGLITVEPGVTQQQLYEYLTKNDWDYVTPVTGAGPNCSILSNALERGYGITPRTDHFEAVTAMKVIYPSPDLCHKVCHSAISELDRKDDDFIDKTYKWKVGPYLDGLVTQSNFGVVPEITIRLGRKPRYFSAFYLRCFGESKFESLVELANGILRDFEGSVGAINLMDKRRIASMVEDNPNGNAHKVMSDEQLQKVGESYKIPDWFILGSINGEPEVVKAIQKSIKRRASGLGTLIFSTSPLISLAKAITNICQIGPLKKVASNLESLELGQEIMKGKPNQIALPLAYWRNANKPNLESKLLPHEDNCGLLWYAPLMPMKPGSMREFVNFIRESTPNFGIEPLITFTNLKHDCVDSTVPILFDLENPDSVEKAHACVNFLVEEGLKRGFVPYRLNINQQQSLLDAQSQHWQVVAKLKAAIDPNGILSPGRYNPTGLESSEITNEKETSAEHGVII